MKHEVKSGMTDYSVFVFIPDSAQTDGSGKTGLAHTAITVSGLRMETDNDATVIDYTASLNALASLTAAHNDWGWIEVSSTVAPGVYRLDIADAVFAAGAWSAIVYVCVTTSLAAPSVCEFVLVPDAPITGVNVSQWLGTAAATPTVAGVPEVDITHIGGTAVTAAAGIPEVKVASIANDAITAASIATNAIGAAEIADGAIDAATFAAGAINAAAIADGAIDAATFAAGAIDATAIAANAIGASELAADAVTEIAAGVLAATVTGTTTVAQSLQLLHATLAGKASGLAGTSVVYRNIADTTDVIAATVDADGNRTAVTITYA